MITKQERIKISELIEAKQVALSELNQADFASEVKAHAAFAYVRASDELEAYLDTLVASEANTATNDGWIEWCGGGCPVKQGTRTEMRFKRYPNVVDNGPEHWDWQKTGGDGCIVAYRIVSE